MQPSLPSASPGFVVVMVTAPDQVVARHLATAALQEHLAACANIIPGLESHYWWQGKIENASEVLILFKTIRSQLARLEAVVREHHPYELPEFVTVDIVGGSEKYLAWVLSSVKA